MNAQPKTFMRPPVMPMAASMSHMVASADTIPILSTLSAKSLRHKGQLLVENWLGSGDFDPTSNKIKVMTMKVSKGLEFPVVALPGVGHMPAARDEREAARVFYVAATRATKRLVMGVVGGDGKLGVPLSLL